MTALSAVRLLRMLWAERKFKGLKFFYFFIFGGNSVAISRALLTIEHGDEVTVNVLNVKGVVIPGGMIRCV